MELFVISALTGIGGLMLGVVLGSILGWKKTVELFDENEALKTKNRELEKLSKTEVIEIKDERVDITHDYFKPF